jgi:hypothetical protein
MLAYKKRELKELELQERKVIDGKLYMCSIKITILVAKLKFTGPSN